MADGGFAAGMVELCTWILFGLGIIDVVIACESRVRGFGRVVE